MTGLFIALSDLLFFALHLAGNSFPRPLSAKEETECLERIKQGDEAARNTLVEHNLRLVAHVIKKYYASADDQDDLISTGTIGLIKAASTFDSYKGSRFATYAARCIENDILSQRNERVRRGVTVRGGTAAKSVRGVWDTAEVRQICRVM